MLPSISYDRDWTWLAFPAKPEEQTRTAVKSLGFRWSVKREMWYAPRHVEENELSAVIGENIPTENTPSAPKSKPEPKPTKSEAERARDWFNNLNLEAMAIETGEKAEFFKYEVSVYRAKIDRFYLTARSPQARQHRYSMGDAYGRGTPDDIRAGFECFLEKMEAKNARHNEKRDAKRNARANFINPYNVGDILHSSWGYEQTNREFYQVLEVRPTALKIRQITQERNEQHGWMSGTCVPCKGKFLKDPARWVTIQIDVNYHSIPSPIYGNLYKWDGKPLDWSGYY